MEEPKFRINTPDYRQGYADGQLDMCDDVDSAYKHGHEDGKSEGFDKGYLVGVLAATVGAFIGGRILNKRFAKQLSHYTKLGFDAGVICAQSGVVKPTSTPLVMKDGATAIRGFRDLGRLLK